ncbi:uncharacterized protein Z520_09204 [Fonsecaea multimorphosa CBS 102226]|uniref:Uncharacterized protein n=1 Tax=Fonsecaea multimorphosa CBS 102226 TaxID=1442371 RepID=A0A0D2GZE8_9EURO|nr:uncharacterized protein Z520_09204 [Fonsecaea multimorphosa CBS 102226]KIX94895.1 hypothetical protein Z520_09204 [Fonsecaea multimorphosa CBS 102226]OAL20786.1 hypothetical protein AYO22_08556 [Fonsecaea multimorphosa]
MCTLKRLLSPFLCCFGIRPSEDHTASDLQTLPSALSVQLPASQIPHAVSQPGSQTADTEALRELFRSSSSVRGYRTASLPSGSNLRREPSLDTDLKLGSQCQPRKQPSRLEQLGNHIKQKLSESRLSKSSSKPQIASENALHDSTGRDNAQLGMSAPGGTLSQRSTGLLELLMSRTASEGGYDSDAKSIQTAALKASDGTIKLSPQRMLSLSSPADIQPIATDGPPPPSPTDTHAPEAPQIEADHPKQGSTPSTPSASLNASSTRVVQSGKHELPLEAPKHVTDREVDGIIELAEASALRAAPAFVASEIQEHDPFTSSPLKDGALSKRDCKDFAGVLKMLGDNVSRAKRESQISNATNPRASLVSQLDPNLLDFISTNGERPSAEISGRTSDGNAAAFVVKSDPLVTANMDPANASILRREGISRKDPSSLSGSDRNSVHLYNMRISQRLASPSFVAASSRPNTSHTTIQPPRETSPDSSPSTRQISMASKIGGLITVEHNRRPSDPETKRLFEGDLARRRASSSRRPGTSPGHTTAFGNPMPLSCTEDASSFYWSDGECDDVGPSRRRTHKTNPNSIAIGGRSESISIPIGSSSASIGNMSVAEEGAWFSRKSPQQKQVIEQKSGFHEPSQRNRSVSMPDRSNPDSWPHLAVPWRRLQKSTEENEAMSEISTDHLQDARKEQLTEISAQAIRDIHNERMSEIEPRGPNKSQESATNMWQRSLRQALEEPEKDTIGGFLTSPKFDRDGRPRSMRSSISAVQSSHHSHRDSDAELDLDSLQEIQIRNESPRPEERRRLQVCIKKPDPLPTVHPRRSTANIDAGNPTPNTRSGKKTSRKKSILDIGRRFTVIGASNESEKASGASTPLKDLFGHWGRFPSHTREDRCGSAGPKDGVAIRDFALDYQDENTPSSLTPRSPWAGSMTTRGLHTPGSWKMLHLVKKDGGDKARNKSIRGTQSLVVRHKKSRKGLAGRWKRLYRSSSAELRAYALTHGHRSSISVGASVEYPELEVIAGDGDERRIGACEVFDRRPDMDGPAETDHLQDRQVVNRLHDRSFEPLDTQPWTRMYQDCVGSLSALRSDPDLKFGGLGDGPHRLYDRHLTSDSVQSEELRDSTVDFERQLGREHETVTEALIRKIEGMDHSEERLDVNTIASVKG